MAKYVCEICGYVYDESLGDKETGISPGKKWEDVSRDWKCPLCGASKTAFKEVKVKKTIFLGAAPEEKEEELEDLHELSFGELSALCSNLGKGCEKQYLFEEAKLFEDLSVYYQKKTKTDEENNIQKILASVEQDLSMPYKKAKDIALNANDRGALRSLVWSEKVTKLLKSILSRYEKEGESAFLSSNVFVCEICGFIYIGETPPDICPICKVPKSKITKVQRG